MPRLARVRRSRFAAAASAVLLTTATLLASGGGVAEAALPGLTIQATMPNCFLRGVGASAPMTVTVRNAAGKRKGTFPAQISGGSWAADCRAIVLAPHDVVRLAATSSGTVLRSFTVPVITATLDRVAGRLSGIVTGTTNVTVGVYTCPVQDDDCATDHVVSIPLGTDGGWVLNLPGPANGRQFADVTWTAGLDQVDLWARFPRLVVTLGSVKVEGSGNPGRSTVAISAKRGGAVAGAKVRVSARRGFAGTLRRNGVARLIAVGDRVRWSIGTTLQGSFVVPAAKARATTTHITGVCLPNLPVVVFAQSPNRKISLGGQGTAGADGRFDITWTPTAGWSAWAECQTPASDVIRTPRVPVR